MKYVILTVSLISAILAAANINAQKLYMWTDENGVEHISDRPPRKTDKVENLDVMPYEEKSPREIEAIELKKETLRRKLDKEKQIERARRAEIQAKEAREQAQEKLQQAREDYEYNKEYIRRLTSTKNKRKKFRNRVRRLKAESEASLAEAEAAFEQADEAVREAQSAAEEVRRQDQGSND